MGLVSEAVDRVSQGHSLELVDVPKKLSGKRCRLQSGVEMTFVGLFCNYLTSYLARQDIRLPFHQLFYIPSRRAERLVGYDLSIGKYQSDARTRTMHKVLGASWCDQEWEWAIQALFTRQGDPKGDYGHLRTLLESYDQNATLVPYLVLNVCYCIHDYRRMGVDYEGYPIPALGSLLRTAIISLPAIPRNALADSGFRLTVTKNAPAQREDETPREYLARLADKDLFDIRVRPGNIRLSDCILTLDDFCARIEQGFLGGK